MHTDPWLCPDCKKQDPTRCALHDGGTACPVTGRRQPTYADRVDASTSDYDAGLFNDFGGGNIAWWHDYLQAEIGRCNAYWRIILRSANVKAEAPK